MISKRTLSSNAGLSIVYVFQNMKETARQYHQLIGRHLQISGSGELYGVIPDVLNRHRNSSEGSAG